MLLTKLKIASAFLVLIVTVGSAAGLVYKMQPTQRPKGERGENAAAAQATNAEDPRRKAYNVLLQELFEDEAAEKTGKRLRWDYFAPRFMKYAEEKNTENIISCDAASWIVHNGKIDGPEFAKAVACFPATTPRGSGPVASVRDSTLPSSSRLLRTVSKD